MTLLTDAMVFSRLGADYPAFGAGAIGGYVGARLAHKAEVDISLVARGPHLAAMEAKTATVVSRELKRVASQAERPE